MTKQNKDIGEHYNETYFGEYYTKWTRLATRFWSCPWETMHVSKRGNIGVSKETIQYLKAFGLSFYWDVITNLPEGWCRRISVGRRSYLLCYPNGEVVWVFPRGGMIAKVDYRLVA